MVHHVRLVPTITTTTEQSNFIASIQLVSLDDPSKPPALGGFTPEELREFASLVSTIFPSPKPTKPHPQPPSHTMAMNTTVGWKSAIFFSALLEIMIKGPPYPSIRAVTTMLVNGADDRADITACAHAMKPAVVHKVVTALIDCRKALVEQLRRINVAARNDGASESERQWSSEPDLSESERTRKRQAVVLLEERLDRWIKLEDERKKEWEMTKTHMSTKETYS